LSGSSGLATYEKQRDPGQGHGVRDLAVGVDSTDGARPPRAPEARNILSGVISLRLMATTRSNNTYGYAEVLFRGRGATTVRNAAENDLLDLAGLEFLTPPVLVLVGVGIGLALLAGGVGTVVASLRGRLGNSVSCRPMVLGECGGRVRGLNFPSPSAAKASRAARGHLPASRPRPCPSFESRTSCP